MKDLTITKAPDLTEEELEIVEEDQIKIVKGKCYFVFENGKIKSYCKDFDDYEKDMLKSEYTIYDLIDGKSFAESVKCKGFTDYDGSLCEIFVNDYISNLGIWYNTFHQGEGFYLSLMDFEKLCGQYKVEVNWANK